MKVAGGVYDAFGIDELKIMMEAASTMKHISEAGINYDNRLAYRLEAFPNNEFVYNSRGISKNFGILQPQRVEMSIEVSCTQPLESI